LFTGGQGIHLFSAGRTDPGTAMIEVRELALTVEALDAAPGALEAAALALVEVADDPSLTYRLCQELHVRRPTLPILGLASQATDLTVQDLDWLREVGLS